MPSEILRLKGMLDNIDFGSYYTKYDLKRWFLSYRDCRLHEIRGLTTKELSTLHRTLCEILTWSDSDIYDSKYELSKDRLRSDCTFVYQSPAEAKDVVRRVRQIDRKRASWWREVRDLGVHVKRLEAAQVAKEAFNHEPVRVRVEGIIGNSDIFLDIELDERRSEKIHDLTKRYTECADPVYMDFFVGHLLDIEKRNQFYQPFVCLNGPSGCGKTSIAYNLAAQTIPMLCWSQEEVCGEYVCEESKPLQLFSYQISRAIKRDLERLGNPKCTSIVDFEAMRQCKRNPEYRFRFVHVLVEMFRKILSVRRKNKDIDWIQAQLSESSTVMEELTIFEGAKQIHGMKQNGIPLVVFLDGTCLDPRKSSFFSSPNVQLVFTCTILRMLRIIPIIACCDARAISVGLGEYKWPHYPLIGRHDIDCLVINDFPHFNKDLLGRRCDEILRVWENDLAIVPVLDFIKSNYLNDNPWTIQIALDFLARGKSEESGTTSSILKGLVNELFRDFVKCKRIRKDFCKTQLDYMLSYQWKDDLVIVNYFDSNAIHRHFGYLVNKRQPESCEAYFYLHSDGKSHTYLPLSDWNRTTSLDTSENADKVAFEPKSSFASFGDSTLTGLLLFGIDSSPRTIKYVHPFASTEAHGLTSIDAVLEFARLPYVSGLPFELVEKVHHCAILMASRAASLSKCSFSVFLPSLIRQLMTTRGCTPLDPPASYPVKLPKVTICGKNEFDSKTIPMISPTAAKRWPKALLELMLTASDHEFRPGMMQYLTSENSIASVVYECDTGTDQSDQSDQPDQEPEYDKVYCKFGSTFNVDYSAMNRIAMITDFRPTLTPLSLDDVKEYVIREELVKMERHSTFHNLQTTECNLYVIICLKSQVHKDVNTREDYKSIREIKATNYHLWYLDRQKNCPTSFYLRSIPKQNPRKAGNKDLVIIALEEIWGDRFMDGLFMEEHVVLQKYRGVAYTVPS